MFEEKIVKITTEFHFPPDYIEIEYSEYFEQLVEDFSPREILFLYLGEKNKLYYSIMDKCRPIFPIYYKFDKKILINKTLYEEFKSLEKKQDLMEKITEEDQKNILPCIYCKGEAELAVIRRKGKFYVKCKLHYDHCSPIGDTLEEAKQKHNRLSESSKGFDIEAILKNEGLIEEDVEGDDYCEEELSPCFYCGGELWSCEDNNGSDLNIAYIYCNNSPECNLPSFDIVNVGYAEDILIRSYNKVARILNKND